MKVTLKNKGGFSKITRFFDRVSKEDIYASMEKLGKIGVDALISATPSDSGETASSWGYEIQKERGKTSLAWTNSNVVDGVPVVILIQYGHATGTGGYVSGVDFINPAIRPIFDEIADTVWDDITNA